MTDRDRLTGLRAAAEEGFSGLHAGEQLRRSVLSAAQKEPARRRMPARALAPVLCAAALAVVGFSVFRPRLSAPAGKQASEPDPVELEGEAGQAYAFGTEEADTAYEEAYEEIFEAAEDDLGVASLGALQAGAGEEESAAQPRALSPLQAAVSLDEEEAAPGVFSAGEREIPVILARGAAYRMLEGPFAPEPEQLGEALFTVGEYTETPSLLVGQDRVVSNVCPAGEAVRPLAAYPQEAVLACRVDGTLRLFQRVSYAGLGTAGDPLEKTLPVRGRTARLELVGRGTLDGAAARAAADLLLDTAQKAAEDAVAADGAVIFTTDDGLQLQMNLSGDLLTACGAWSCPAFLAAFDAAAGAAEGAEENP